MGWGGPIRPSKDGGYRLSLDDDERGALRDLCDELRGLIESEHPGTARLFPAAYRDDPEASEEYDQLVHGELLAGRLRALRIVEETSRAERLDHEQLAAWCGALNDLRLVLGERLGVTEDLYVTGFRRDDPHGPQLALYGWLTWLQGEVVEALASRVPDA